MGEKSQLTFRISLWRPWLLAVTPLALLAALGLAITIAAGQLAAASTLLLGLAGVAVALLVPVGLAVRANRWHVDSNGIGGRNNRLVYHRLDWSEIESVVASRVPIRAGERRRQALGVLAALIPHRHARISLRGSAVCPSGQPVAALPGATPGLSRRCSRPRSGLSIERPSDDMLPGALVSVPVI
jgi:hypothetical protein